MFSKGFTLIELLVSIGIFAIVAALSVPFGLSWFRTEHHRETITLIDQTLNQTQARAMASDGAQDWNIHITEHALYVSPGSSYLPGSATEVTIPAHSRISTATPIDIIFAAVRGESRDTIFSVTSSAAQTTYHIYDSGAISKE